MSAKQVTSASRQLAGSTWQCSRSAENPVKEVSCGSVNGGLEFVKCNICQEDETEVFLRDNGAVQFVKCRHDGLLYMNPRPRVESIRRFHSQFVRDDNLAFFSDYRRGVLGREAQIVKAFKSRGSLLDVGCATGTFFENFRPPDWRTYGVDTSALGSRLARHTHHASVFCGTVREANYTSLFFDVITMLDTLYYSADPYAELVELNRILKDDGLLAIEIPGYAYSLLRDKGPICWMLDGTWMRGFTKTRHLYYFSPRALRLLLERAGFRIIKVVPEQASLGRHGVARLLNETHFALARAIFAITSGRLSIAGKEVYLAGKANEFLSSKARSRN
jgi:SAM-dependent methyltransferase